MLIRNEYLVKFQNSTTYTFKQYNENEYNMEIHINIGITQRILLKYTI